MHVRMYESASTHLYSTTPFVFQFADLAGFTKWSSTKEPKEVFLLLGKKTLATLISFVSAYGPVSKQFVQKRSTKLLIN